MYTPCLLLISAQEVFVQPGQADEAAGVSSQVFKKAPTNLQVQLVRRVDDFI